MTYKTLHIRNTISYKLLCFKLNYYLKSYFKITWKLVERFRFWLKIYIQSFQLALQQPNASFTYKLVHKDTEQSSRETIVNGEPKYIANDFFRHLEDILDNTIVSM